MAASTINLASAPSSKCLKSPMPPSPSRCGQEVAIIVPIDEWKRLNPAKETSPVDTPGQSESMWDFRKRSPLRDQDLLIPG